MSLAARSAVDALTDSAQDALFKVPPRIGVPSAWYGHVPFAFWIVAATRPRILVELGTQNGVSYAAFCESVLEQRLDTKCYAVDTWRGDEHAGFYPQQVFDDLQAFHDARYGAFSRMLRTTFDDARQYFADGSIDLLHIDGCHTCDQVRHDFETWLPKLSDRAVVLFHDTNVRERHFGVWNFWLELRQRYPSFEFVHEHGLGILGVGQAIEDPLLGLFRLKDPAAIATIRQRFALSGLRGQVASEQRRLEQALSETQSALQHEQEARQAHQAELRAARAEGERLDVIAVANEVRAAEIRRRLAEAEHALAEARRVLEANSHDLAFKDLQIAHFRVFAEEYHALVGSSLWRAMQPVRRVGAAVPPWLRRLLRRGVKSAWWVATPWKLSARLARRREAIARANQPPPPPPALPAPPPPPPAPVDPFALDQIARPGTGYLPIIKYYDPVAPEVSIVVPNWNGGDMTLLCLQHLWQHTTGHHYEIIVVDNGSDPADIEKLRAEAPYVKILALGSNRFFGEANNIGVESALGRFICLLNNDAFVAPGWLEALMRVFATDPHVGAVGPLFIYPNGDPQAAGALINADGTATQLGKGAPVGDPSLRSRRIVDSVSAACLLMRRDDFIRVLGFDLSWDPASYEDVDLCLKLKLLGLTSVYCPDTTVVHLKGATSAKLDQPLGLHNTIAINRAKFLGRWGRYLETAGEERPALLPSRPVSIEPLPPASPHLRVVIYTPYQLTPGGGERYVLTIAEAFKDIAHVSLVTPQPVSRIRLLTMAREFGLDLDQVALIRPDDLMQAQPADLAIVLGNEIFPTVGRMARHNVFICQFPFPFQSKESGERLKPFWHDFERLLTYSEYVRDHVQRIAAEWNVASRPVEILPPPVPMVTARAAKQPGKILHVGRFFTGGHCKRQDRLIEALRLLREQGVEAELHLAGSTMPEPQHRAYYTSLIQQAAGLPVHFHANCSTETLHGLYASSDLYWHATGVGEDVAKEPHLVEHFGISIVEAMSARCIPVVFAAGGPVTIVADGVTGYHYRTVEELAEKTCRLLETSEEAKEAMRTAAAAAAQQYDEPTFRHRVREIAAHIVGAETGS